MSPEIYRQFGLTPPGEIPRHELDEMWKRLPSLVESMLTPGLGWTEEDRRYIGRVYHQFVEGATDWVGPHMKLAQFLTALKVDNENYFTQRIWEAIGPTGAREYALSMGLWYENNYPKVVLDPTYAAALMSTKLNQDAADLVIPPWSAFMIELTDSPLTLWTRKAVQVKVDHIFVHTKQNGFSMTALAGQWDLLSLGTATKADFARDDAEKVEEFLSEHKQALEDLDRSKLLLSLKEEEVGIEEELASMGPAVTQRDLDLLNERLKTVKNQEELEKARDLLLKSRDEHVSRATKLRQSAENLKARANVLEQEGVVLDKSLAAAFMHLNGRLLPLVQRLVAGTCLAMSDPKNIKQRKPQPSRKHSLYKARRGLPLVRVFEVGRPLKVDCRPAITEFLKGRRSSVKNVQTLVRGHWKSQAHGPNHSLRKALHIEPYWRGDEDAPIRIRPHTLGA